MPAPAVGFRNFHGSVRHMWLLLVQNKLPHWFLPLLLPRQCRCALAEPDLKEPHLRHNWAIACFGKHYYSAIAQAKLSWHTQTGIAHLSPCKACNGQASLALSHRTMICSRTATTVALYSCFCFCHSSILYLTTHRTCGLFLSLGSLGNSETC